MIALGVLGIAGVGIGIAKHKKAADLEKVVNETKTKLDDVTKKLAEAEAKATQAEKALADANKTIDGLKNPEKKPFFLKRWGSAILNTLKSMGRNKVF